MEVILVLTALMEKDEDQLIASLIAGIPRSVWIDGIVLTA